MIDGQRLLRDDNLVQVDLHQFRENVSIQG